MKYGIRFNVDGQWLVRCEQAWNVDGAYMKCWKSVKYVGLFNGMEEGQEWLAGSGIEPGQVQVVSKVNRAVVHIRCWKDLIASCDRKAAKAMEEKQYWEEKFGPKIGELETLLLQQSKR